jgi:hypothetical protein
VLAGDKHASTAAVLIIEICFHFSLELYVVFLLVSINRLYVDLNCKFKFFFLHCLTQFSRCFLFVVVVVFFQFPMCLHANSMLLPLFSLSFFLLKLDSVKDTFKMNTDCAAKRKKIKRLKKLVLNFVKRSFVLFSLYIYFFFISQRSSNQAKLLVKLN